MLKLMTLLATLAVVTQGAQPPLVRENATARVAPHTYVIPDNNVGGVPNVGIVVGTRATLVIDTGMGPRNGETILKEARQVSTTATLYLATTHVHPEHDLGASAFPAGTTMIRSGDQQKDIDEFGLSLAKTFSDRSAINAELLKGAEFRKADVFFDKEHVVDLGGVRVRIEAVGPTHTRGDTIFFVEGDKVLFAGDVVMPALPAFASPYSSVKAWIAALDRLAALTPARIVPSHGAMGDTAMIDSYREYLTGLRDRARELKGQDVNRDAAVETMTRELEKKYENRVPSRIAPAARVAYTEG